SDLLFPLEALGMELAYTDRGPQLGWSLDESTISRLRSVDDAWPRLQFQGEAVRATRERLPDDRSLIGFIGGPWTLFVYAVEGTHKGSLTNVKRLLPLFPRFCDSIIPLLRCSVQSQLDNGAEVVMIFDTAAGELSPDLFQNEVVRQLRLIIEKVKVGDQSAEPRSGTMFIEPEAESTLQSSFRSETSVAHEWANRSGESEFGFNKHRIPTGFSSPRSQIGYYSKGTQPAH